MKTVVGIVMAVVFFFTFSALAIESKKDDDPALRSKIVGSWAEGSAPYGISTFNADGTYEAKMWETAERLKLIVSAYGKWWIKEGKLYNTVHKVEPPIFPAAQEPIVDVIVSISAESITLIDARGKQYTKTKVR